MAAPLGKPLFPPTAAGRTAGVERRVRMLEQRNVSRWVYVNGIPAPGSSAQIDETGIDATTWTDSNLPGVSFTWQSPWTEGGGLDANSDALTKYRVGFSGFEMVLNAAGGTVGTIMFTLLADYWDYTEGKQTFTATDDQGNFTCYTIVPRNDYSACADVYAGRV